MMRRMYDWMMGMAGSPRAPWALGIVSFIESSFFPIPPDVMLIPMVLKDRSKAWWYATLATVTSVAGGILGYAIGYFFFEAIGKPILDFYGREHALDSFIQFVHEYGVPAIIIKGATPIPFKVFTLASGAVGIPLLPFFFGPHRERFGDFRGRGAGAATGLQFQRGDFLLQFRDALPGCFEFRERPRQFVQPALRVDASRSHVRFRLVEGIHAASIPTGWPRSCATFP